MSEYWKSTPKYHCKFCNAYVRDTKLDRQQHESTARHQGAVRRSLRDLHRSHDREERERRRAKDEVARLDGIVAGSKAGGPAGAAASVSKSGADASPQASRDERKRQLAQLASLGVAIPEEFRREMAMAGDWEMVAQRRVDDAGRGGTGDTDAKSFGVYKRKRDEDEDEEADEVGAASGGKGWGSRFKAYKREEGGDVDIGALIGAGRGQDGDAGGREKRGDGSSEAKDDVEAETADTVHPIKKEEDEPAEPPTALDGSHADKSSASLPPVKHEDEFPEAPVVFKKRRKPGRP